VSTRNFGRSFCVALFFSTRNYFGGDAYEHGSQIGFGRVDGIAIGYGGGCRARRLDVIELRAVSPQDAEFLYAVYAASREDELAPVPWTPQQKELFLRQQFHAQDTHYRQHFPDARFDVIVADGEPIGRFYVERKSEEIHVIDIALLPAHRNKGIGGGLMSDILSEAKSMNQRASIFVEKNNPAQTLYDRLGFIRKQDFGIYWFMVKEPA
jgi:ribosomal protein S18 acetylase RimI-like enzyme